MALIAWYKLDGDAKDSSGNGHHGTAHNVSWTDGKIGQAGSFNNSNSYVNCGNSDAFNIRNQITLSAWVKLSSLDNWKRVIKRGDHTQYQMDISRDRELRMEAWNDSGERFRVMSNTILEDDVWNHCLVMIDGKHQILYVNGIEEDRATWSGLIADFEGYDLNIGRGTRGGSTTYLDGSIDDVRIYDHALSVKEIKELAKAKVLHYTFNDPESEPTENLFSSVSHNTWSRSDTTFSLDVLSNYKLRAYGEQTSSGSNGQYYYPNFSAEGGNYYTVSAKVKLKNSTNTSSSSYSAIRLREGSNGSDVSVDNELYYSDMKIGKEYKISSSGFLSSSQNRITTAISVAYNLGVGEYVDVEIYDMQLEKKPHATPFTPSTREGIVKDQSGYNNHGTIELDHSPAWTTNSKIGVGAYEFDGADDYFKNSSFIAHTKSITATCWIYPNNDFGDGDRSWIFSKKDGDWRDFSLYLRERSGEQGSSIGACFSGGSLHTSGTFIPDQWNFICMAHDPRNSNTKVWLNGDVILNESESIDTVELGDIVIGRRESGSDYYANATIDDVRIYATALSDSDVKQLYESRANLDDHGNFKVERLDSKPFNVSAFPDPSGSSHNGSYGLRFTVKEPLIIKSSTVHPYFSGTMTTQLRNFDTGEIVQEVESEVISGEDQEIKLDLFCKPGINYWMTPTGGNFMRTDRGVSFPIEDGLFDFTISANAGGSTADRWYYYFGIRYARANSLKETGVYHTSNVSEVGIVDGLSGWHPLKENTYDKSGFRNHPSHNNVKFLFNKKECSYFNGVDSSLTFSNDYRFEDDDTFSIALWAKIMSNGRFLCAHRYHLQKSTFRTRGSQGLSVDTGIEDSDWHYIVITYKSKEVTSFVDGVKVDSDKTTGSPLSSYTAHNLMLGGTRHSGGSYEEVYLQDVRIFNRALSKEEINILYETTGENDTKMKMTKDTLYTKGSIKEV